MIQKKQDLTLDGLTGPLAAVGYGDSTNPPVFALHGWLDNAASFAPLSTNLPDYYIVALDFAGHGQSAHRPQGAVYHMLDYIADVVHAVESLGWESFNLMGHSLGAGVAIVYAAAFTEKVSKLVLIDGVGPISANADSATDRLRKSVDFGLERSQKTMRPPRNYETWDKLIEARCLASSLERSSAELLVRRGAEEINEQILLRADSRLKQPSPMYMSEDVVRHFISRIDAPTQLFLAREGRVIKRSMTDGRVAEFQNVEVIECDGQHHVHMDQPEILAGDIVAFLSRLN